MCICVYMYSSRSVFQYYQLIQRCTTQYSCCNVILINSDVCVTTVESVVQVESEEEDVEVVAKTTKKRKKISKVDVWRHFTNFRTSDL